MLQHETHVFYSCCLALLWLNQTAELRKQDFLYQLKSQGWSVNIMEAKGFAHIYFTAHSYKDSFYSFRSSDLQRFYWMIASNARGFSVLRSTIGRSLNFCITKMKSILYNCTQKQQNTQRTHKITSSQVSSGFQLDTVICHSSLFQIWSQRRFWNHVG